jgi:hypothetical protein
VSEELTAAASREFKFSDIDFRDLAQRSATAAKEIKQLIDNSVEKVNAGTFLARDAGATMKDIIDSVSHVTGIMSDISSASAEQSSGITQVNDAVMQMDGATQQNAALVEEAAAATGGLEQQGEKLMQALRCSSSRQTRPASRRTLQQRCHQKHRAAKGSMTGDCEQRADLGVAPRSAGQFYRLHGAASLEKLKSIGHSRPRQSKCARSIAPPW